MTAGLAWILGAILAGYLIYAAWWAIRDPEAREMARLDGWARPWQFVGLLALAAFVAWSVFVGLAAVIVGG